MKEFADWPTFPMLWANGEFVGGLDIVKEMIENGEFDEVMGETSASESGIVAAA